MPGEIRVDTIKSNSGLGTVTYTASGQVFTGITTSDIFETNTIKSVAGLGTITLNNSGQVFSGITTITVNNINQGPISGTRNMIINGSMVVNQRGFTGAAGTTTNQAYTTDRFNISLVHDGAVSAGQTSMTSGNAYADGFQNALILRVTTADASLTAGQYQFIQQRIEGYNVQGIKKGTANALPVTLSFWVRSTTTGTYILELYDIDNTRSVSQAYTINAADTWEKKILTFPADTTGVFDNDNNSSLTVIWWLAASSTYSGGTLNTSWATQTDANRAVGQTNLLAATINNFWLTGVQLEVGPQATEFERRSYGQELALCQRYYEIGSSGYLGYGGAGTGVGAFVSFAATKRTTPTITTTPFSYTNASGSATTNITIHGFVPYGATTAVGNVIVYNNWTASSEL